MKFSHKCDWVRGTKFEIEVKRKDDSILKMISKLKV